MRKTISLPYQNFVRKFYLLITISTIFACSQNKRDQHSISEKVNTLKPPVTITAKSPVVILLDTCPSPRTIAIPQNKSDSYVLRTEDGANTIQILPPEIKSAGFFVPVQNFTTGNGLTHNAVMKGYKDKSGNLWFSTYGGGVSRYDGKSFTNYTTVQGLVSNNVWSICEDDAGNMWFGTDGDGVSRYDGKSFISYDTTDGLTGNTVFTIIKDKKGNLWFGTWDGGVSRLNHDGSFKNYTASDGLVSNHISSILEDKNGNMWFGTWSDGVTRYKDGSFINFTADDGLANNTVGGMLEDKNGTIWLGNGSGKISWLDSNKKLEGEKWKFRNHTIAEGLSDIHNITEDRNGNLWFGMFEGAIRLSCDKKSNPDRESFISFTTRQGLLNNNVNSILEDQSGNMWFCTDGGGVSLISRGLDILTSLTINDILPYSKVGSVLEDKAGNIWIGTLGEGALRLGRDGKSLSIYTTSQGLPDNFVFDIFEDKSGNIWFGCNGSLSRLDREGKSFTNYTTAHGLLKDIFVVDILEDKEGNIWFATIEGVYRLDFNYKSIAKYTTDQGLLSNKVKNIIEDKNGNLWIGTEGGGVSRYDGNAFTNYTTEHGLLSNNISGFLQDKSGNLWIGTSDGGVNRYDGKSFKGFTTTQGLSHDKIKDLMMDEKGMIWLGTEKGFTILKGFVHVANDTLNHSGQKNLQPSNELSNSELERNHFKPVFEIYNMKTGYAIEEIASNLQETREGIVWAGTGRHEKTVRFDYNSIYKNSNPPNVFIQGIQINNELISWYNLRDDAERIDSFRKTPNGMEEVNQFGKLLDEDQRKAMRKKFSAIKFDSISPFYPLPVNLVLPYGYNNIIFDFRAIAPAHLGLIRYQYMMEGYDKGWNPVTDKTNATYGNMHEGNYTFKLKAQSPDGVWSTPITYSFKVLPPWWRTWWFIITAVVCLVTLFYLLIRWRLREKFRLQLERSEKEKQVAEMKQKTAELQQQTTELEMQALRAQMNPHFIFNSLNSINMFILENNKQQASDYLSKFSRLVRLILQNSQEEFIPLDKELEALGLYLELESLRFEQRFEYRISVNDEVDTTMVKVPPLIIQPYAENAIWHGLMHKKEKGHLEIEIYLEEKLLYCRITDDGIGRKKAAELQSKSSLTYKSMGMRITADRLAILQQREQNATFIAIKDLVLPDGRAAGTEVLIKIPVNYD